MFIIRLEAEESKRIHDAVQSGREVSFLRSDSDNHTFHAFSTPSTLCSESERKDETPYLDAFRAMKEKK
jgi:hypothetical protein